MTEEIINGVDVSGYKYINCCCYENGKCLWTKRYYENSIVPDCEKVKDCYYKRMKRLEQELEKIKEIVTKYSQHEGYLLDDLFTDLVDELSEVLKDGHN